MGKLPSLVQMRCCKEPGRQITLLTLTSGMAWIAARALQKPCGTLLSHNGLATRPRGAAPAPDHLSCGPSTDYRPAASYVVMIFICQLRAHGSARRCFTGVISDPFSFSISVTESFRP